MTYKPTAPPSAVSEVVKTFRGQWIPNEQPGYTTAQFDSRVDMSNALHLVNMLGGWNAEGDPDRKLVLRIWQDE